MYFTIYSTLALTVVSAIKLSGVSFINQTIITNKDITIIKFMIFTSLLSGALLMAMHSQWLVTVMGRYDIIVLFDFKYHGD